MERPVRKPFQGVINIIRFNWHYYVIACSIIVTVLCFGSRLNSGLYAVIMLIVGAVTFGIIISLVVSWYVYDRSHLYALSWLNKLPVKAEMKVVNIHAGFDETSLLIRNRYPESDLVVFDFYDRLKHTEVSIERARKMYPVYPGTILINTDNVPLTARSVDYIFLILSAHEIRNDEERTGFFRQLQEALRDNGKIVVAEHQRDLFNFLAYNLGFFHFYSANTWKHNFVEAGLSEEECFKVTPFISAFILRRNGDLS